jgi:hypothetical protein
MGRRSFALQSSHFSYADIYFGDRREPIADSRTRWEELALSTKAGVVIYLKV